MSRMKFSELSGKDVISQDGRDLGEVADVVLDVSGWRIDALVVKLARDLLESFHMKRPLFGTQTIQIPTSQVSGVGDKVILHKTLEELTALAREELRRDSPKSAPKAEPAKGESPKPEAKSEAANGEAASVSEE
jgi:sporulation protein YlmC with PRC-barrel domain